MLDSSPTRSTSRRDLQQTPLPGWKYRKYLSAVPSVFPETEAILFPPRNSLSFKKSTLPEVSEAPVWQLRAQLMI